jgi:3-methylfumaryl-CoA hydratase
MTEGTPESIASLDAWVGRTSTETDVVGAGAVRGLMATLHSRDMTPIAGDCAPLLAHWLHFLPYTPLDEVGPDGHPRRGDFLPPVQLPRRMWAGSDIRFQRPLRIGAKIERRSTIGEVRETQGRTGPLVFVRVDHEIHDEDGLVLTDSHNIVYRDMPTAGAKPKAGSPAPADPQWRRRVDPDPVLLFRYSALTFNGHRIHYDRSYVTQVEGYPGLVVHGPLIATLLLHELVAQRPEAVIDSYTFRAVQPIFDTTPFFVCGSAGDDGVAHLFASNETGELCMSATATFR